MRITVLNRQSLLDIAIERDGSIETILDIAEANGMAVTDDLAAGREVETGSAAALKKQVVVRLAAYGAKPATGISREDTDRCPFGGIVYMGIEYDFIVK